MTETPRERVMRALARLVDHEGIAAGISEEAIATEAGVTPLMAKIELGTLVFSKAVLVFENEDGLVWVLPDYEDAVR